MNVVTSAGVLIPFALVEEDVVICLCEIVLCSNGVRGACPPAQPVDTTNDRIELVPLFRSGWLWWW